MFKKKFVTNPGSDEKVTRTVVTKTVEKTGGVQTTTTTINSITKDDFESAFKRFNLDPEKFQSGGRSVTKTIVYTDSSGKKEVLEETVETYGDPDKTTETVKSKVVKSDEPLNKKMGNFCKSPFSSVKAATHRSAEESKAHTPVTKPGQFQDECLQAHNSYRAKHGVAELSLSKEICDYSQEWADHLAATDSFKHRSERKYGENIFMKWSSDPNHMISGNEPVDSWYSEIKDHVFGREPTSMKSGHFTQVIWKDSKNLGIAWARSKTGKILVVANYDPAGNFIGRYTQNVPAPKK